MVYNPRAEQSRAEQVVLHLFYHVLKQRSRNGAFLSSNQIKLK